MLVGLLMATSTVALAGAELPDEPEPGAPGASSRCILPLAVLIVPLADFTLAVLRRLRAGKSPFSADRKHLHHRLLDMGHSHVHAVILFYAWTAVASVGMLLFLIPGRGVVIGGIVLIVGFLVCTIVTLAPLSGARPPRPRCKTRPPRSRPMPGSPNSTRLDAAAEAIDVGTEHSDAEAASALERLHEKESSP